MVTKYHFSFKNSNFIITLIDSYKTAPCFFFNKQKLDDQLFVDFCAFTCFDTKNFYVMIFRTVFGSQQVKTQKSTNNWLSDFGLIEQNMDFSCIHLAEILRPIAEQISFS